MNSLEHNLVAGTWLNTSGRNATMQRCQRASGRYSAALSVRPRQASEMISCTPLRPRSTRCRRNADQTRLVLFGAFADPKISRKPQNLRRWPPGAKHCELRRPKSASSRCRRDSTKEGEVCDACANGLAGTPDLPAAADDLVSSCMALATYGYGPSEIARRWLHLAIAAVGRFN